MYVASETRNTAHPVRLLTFLKFIKGFILKESKNRGYGAENYRFRKSFARGLACCPIDGRWPVAAGRNICQTIDFAIQD
jgi:hypothetical protein